MARPTNVEPKHGEAGQDKGEDTSVHVEGKLESSGPGASGKDAEDAQEKTTSLTEDSKDAAAQVTKDNASKDGGTASDNDTGERPVREKLRETSIAGLHNAPAERTERAESPDDTSMASQKSNSVAGEASDTSSVDGKARSAKKRSFDDVQPGDANGESNTDDETAHRRKRSRESTPGDSAEVQKNNVEPDSMTDDKGDDTEKTTTETKAKDDDGTANPAGNTTKEENGRQKLMSPKKKRSRDQFDNDLKEEVVAQNQDDKTSGQDAPGDSDTPADSNAAKDKGEPEKKRHRDNSQERSTAKDSDLSTAKIPSTSAFSNSSAVSPFASLASSKSPGASEKPAEATSSSAFASSSLAAFAGSEKSPFSSLAGSTPSAFGSATTTESKKPEATGFAGTSSETSAASPFASTGTSGFGKLGAGSGFAGTALSGGFAAATQSSGGLTSFAAPTGSAVLGSGSSKAKPFGTPADTDADEEEGEGEEEKPAFEGLGGEEKEDERFFKQQTETGEEGEETQFACKAKLFHFNGKEWKERGIGNFKLNVTKGAEEDSKPSARLIMRADGALRVILNTPVFKGMTVGDASGEEPTSKQVHLASLENGRSVPLLLRTGSYDLAKELYNKIESVKEIL